MRVGYGLLLGASVALSGAGESPHAPAPGESNLTWGTAVALEGLPLPGACLRWQPEKKAAVKRAPPAVADPSAYYAVDLVTTKKLPGTARAAGTGHLTFAASPFGVALAPDGSFLYDASLRLMGMKRPAEGVLVAWVTTPQVDQIVRLGAFDPDLTVHGQVGWNKFLLVVTLEERDDPGAATWTGPIVFRGMSRSGMMHTMAGHGPFQKELCAKYGY